MIQFFIGELTILIPAIAVSFVVFIYYRERDVYSYRRYATFLPRFWAAFIDTTILWPAGILLRFVLFWYDVQDEVLKLMAYNVVAFIYPFYAIYLHGRYDATLGKMACKLKLLRARREVSISFIRAFFRDFIPVASMAGIFSWVFWAENADDALHSPLFFAIPGIYYFWLVVELLTMHLSRRRRAFQDVLAGTVVVRAE